jgi:hypothetical protein
VSINVSVRVTTFVASVFLASCASLQLNYNTLDVSSSVADLYTRQVLVNLSRFIDEPEALPSQADLSAGTIQTSNSVTPSLTAPLSKTLTWNGSGALTTQGINNTGLSISAADGWQQNWNVSPLSDANTLRNLRAVYRYAVFRTNLISEYHVPRLSNNGKLVLDQYALELPQCIVCKPKGYVGPFYVNPKLKAHWLYWTSDGASAVPARLPPENASVVDLGHYGNHQLLMLREDFQAGFLSNLTLFLLPNAEPTDVNGKSPSGRAGAPTNRPNLAPPPPPVILPPPPG